jgi:hypothetical protein
MMTPILPICAQRSATIASVPAITQNHHDAAISVTNAYTGLVFWSLVIA